MLMLLRDTEDRAAGECGGDSDDDDEDGAPRLPAPWPFEEISSSLLPGIVDSKICSSRTLEGFLMDD
jgi:hypothetical protein